MSLGERKEWLQKMKSVLISIRPKWCRRIVTGKKTLEVRKTRPKQDAPFKCYIYCTKSPNGWCLIDSPNIRLDGAVIGEFICDTFVEDKTFGHDPLFNAAACMTEIECAVYSTYSPIYGWHISNLKIYDKPKELSDFRKPFPFHKDCSSCDRGGTSFHPETCYGCGHFDGIEISRPPQSWCYVEEI